MQVVAFSLRRHGTRVALLLLIVFLVSGCLHTQASLTVSGDDRVSGQTLIAVETADGRVPFDLRPPPEMADRVRVTPYTADGKAGARLSFTDLTFEEVERLGKALSPSDSRYEFDLSRTGSLVNFEGSLDLTPLAGTDSSFLIELSAPGEITTTNGQQGPDMVRWNPEPGEVTEMTATYQFSGSKNREWVGWGTLVNSVALAVALGIAALAQWEHQRARRAAGDPGY